MLFRISYRSKRMMHIFYNFFALQWYIVKEMFELIARLQLALCSIQRDMTTTRPIQRTTFTSRPKLQ